MEPKVAPPNADAASPRFTGTVCAGVEPGVQFPLDDVGARIYGLAVLEAVPDGALLGLSLLIYGDRRSIPQHPDS